MLGGFYPAMGRPARLKLWGPTQVGMRGGVASVNIDNVIVVSGSGVGNMCNQQMRQRWIQVAPPLRYL